MDSLRQRRFGRDAGEQRHEGRPVKPQYGLGVTKPREGNPASRFGRRLGFSDGGELGGGGNHR